MFGASWQGPWGTWWCTADLELYVWWFLWVSPLWTTWTEIHSGCPNQYQKSSIPIPKGLKSSNWMDDYPIPYPHWAVDPSIACSPLAKFRPQGILPRDANLRSAWVPGKMGHFQISRAVGENTIYNAHICRFVVGLIWFNHQTWGRSSQVYILGRSGWWFQLTYKSQTHQSIEIIIPTRMENNQWLKSPISEKILRFHPGTYIWDCFDIF